jgi:hypothetical protein
MFLNSILTETANNSDITISVLPWTNTVISGATLVPDFTSATNQTDIGPYIWQKNSYYCNYSEENGGYPNYTLYQTLSGTSWVANIGPPLWTSVIMPTIQSVARAEVTAFSNLRYSPYILVRKFK